MRGKQNVLIDLLRHSFVANSKQNSPFVYLPKGIARPTDITCEPEDMVNGIF